MEAKNLFKIIAICIIMITGVSNSGSNGISSTINEERVTYKAGDVTMKGFVAYDEHIKGKRPVVLVVHEWWGLTDYPEMRARKLAELGYLAMAVDLFGNGKTAANPKEAQELTTPFYKDPQLVKTRLDAALKKIIEFPQADPAKVVAIGYCFGGFAVLNYAKLGADLKAVVSFHGGMGGAPVDRNLFKAKVLVCHGADDKFVSVKDVNQFSHQLDSIGIENTVKFYPGAGHAFSNPEATKLGKEFNIPIVYNPQADKDSWNDMKIFLEKVLGC